MKVYMLIEADDDKGHHSIGDEIEVTEEEAEKLERQRIVTRRKPKASSGGDGA